MSAFCGELFMALLEGVRHAVLKNQTKK